MVTRVDRILLMNRIYCTYMKHINIYLFKCVVIISSGSLLVFVLNKYSLA